MSENKLLSLSLSLSLAEKLLIKNVIETGKLDFCHYLIYRLAYPETLSGLSWTFVDLATLDTTTVVSAAAERGKRERSVF